MIFTSSAALRALREAVILPVVQLLSFARSLLLLLFASFAQNTRARSPEAGLTCSRFDPLALVVGQVGDSLGKAEQHLALDGPFLDPGATRPAAGLPGSGNEATEIQEPAG